VKEEEIINEEEKTSAYPAKQPENAKKLISTGGNGFSSSAWLIPLALHQPAGNIRRNDGGGVSGIAGYWLASAAAYVESGEAEGSLLKSGYLSILAWLAVINQ
jgi:hypothetical protein